MPSLEGNLLTQRTKFARKKLETVRYQYRKPRVSISPELGLVPGCKGQTDRITITSSCCRVSKQFPRKKIHHHHHICRHFLEYLLFLPVVEVRRDKPTQLIEPIRQPGVGYLLHCHSLILHYVTQSWFRQTTTEKMSASDRD